MDINAYIASGILQDYALGQVSDQERSEVECMSKIYPELRDALKEAEKDLERFASTYSVKTPAGLKGNIMAAVKEQSQDEVMKTVKDGKALENKEIVIQSEVTEKKSYFGGLAAAAAVIAIFFAAWQYSENQSSVAQLQAYQDQQIIITEKAAELETKVAELSDGLNELYNPSVRKIMLNSVQENNPTKLALLWNTETGEVKLDLAALPLLPEDKQYQLWVLKDGKPSDMGVLSKANSGILIASNTALVGDAFAITIEPLGGLPSPSLDQLVVMGSTT